MQRVKITPANLKTWEANIATFLEKKLIQGTIPESLVNAYVCFERDGSIRVRSRDEVVIPCCPKCGGTGRYRHFGPCWDCAGKGHITFHDQMRDGYYHTLRSRTDDVKP